jgi:hypothetical protein
MRIEKFKVLLYLKKSSPDKSGKTPIMGRITVNNSKADGTTAVMCRISIDGKSSALATGIYCRPEEWNAQKGSIRAERENNRLSEFRARLEQTYENILKQ